ncbi:TadE/TadG family type IV pilus assembly protein [Sphingomonas sp. GCM10030256]|uniref:TadE/TadG family type IV pilus assembly protein n=1 Tax=Sphingomonas sp. GCM10030256 TaxID=3273427 RepID=UPI003609FD1C
MLPLLPNLAQDQRGAAVIELAFAAPILAGLIMVVTDVSNAYSRKLALEQGAHRAIEKVMQTTELKTVQGTIADEVALQANVKASQVSVQFPRYCDGKKMPDTTVDAEGYSDGTPCASTERESHYILITVTDNYKPFFSSLNLGTKQADGTYLIRAEAGMRTA